MSDSDLVRPESARIAHRSVGRLRLRVRNRRRDLPFFLQLYDALRREPEIDEVTLNPATGGVLVWFDPALPESRVADALTRSGLLRLQSPEQLAPDDAARHRFHVSVNDMRIVVFLIMTLLSIHQLRKGQLLAPALTMLLYVIDLTVAMRSEHEAAHGEPASDPDPAHSATP
jgi:hypothetical protein